VTREILQGSNATEPLSVETDMPSQVYETEPDPLGTSSAVDTQKQPTAEPQTHQPPHRRRLGKGESLSAKPVQSGAPEVALDPAQTEELMAGLRAEQSLTIGILGGLLAAVVGAILWATVTVATGFQIGWMAVGVGFMVGRTVGVLGRGVTKRFGYIGAALSLIGCLIGNLLSVCVIVAQQQELALSFVLTHLNPAAIPELMAVTFHPMDLLFYGLAVYQGYRFSFRRVTTADVTRAALSQAHGDSQTPGV
jgi:hypothetical protein